MRYIFVLSAKRRSPTTFCTMKNILLTAALSALTFFGILAFPDKKEAAMPECRLPVVEIKAPALRQEPAREMALPTVTIRAKRLKTNNIILP